MRDKIVAGNWKMNGDLAQMESLLEGIKKSLKTNQKAVKIIVAPAYPNLYPAFESLKKTSVLVAAQNVHQSENGAFTGEVSAQMLKSVGVSTVIIGHSERRKYFQENPELLAKKVDTALHHDLNIIFCVGENLEDREKNKHFEVVKSQIAESLFHLNDTAWKNIVIAYEPVWAIGTGKTASAKQAQEMHGFIRKSIADRYGKDISDNVSIIYGGSVKPDNAPDIFAEADVDGGLIGGASLLADDFLKIIDSF